MKFLTKLFFLALFSAAMFPSTAIAGGDSLSPAEITVALDPGQAFELNYLLQSAQGGDYTFEVIPFEVALDGQAVLLEGEILDGFSFSASEVSLDPGEEAVFSLSLEQGTYWDEYDHYVSVRVNRAPREGEVFTLGFSSLIYIRVGSFERSSVEVGEVTVNKGPSGGIRSLQFELGIDGDRFFSVTPVLSLYDADDMKILESIYLPLRVIPGIQKARYFQYLGKSDFEIPDSFQRAELAFLDEEDDVTLSAPVSGLQAGDIFYSEPAPETVFRDDVLLVTRAVFVWTDWIGHFLLMFLGLIILGYSLYPTKVE